jgi:protein-disulfide isomerase
MKKYTAVLIVSGVLLIAVVAGVFLYRSRGNNDIAAQPPVESSTPSVVTLEEFGDYQCPPCAQLHPTLKEIKQQFGPNLNFVFRNLPLTIHKNALIAAQAAEAARVQNRFWEMHDLLYQNQDAWKDDKNPKARFVKYAGDLGLDTARFEQDLFSDQVRFRLQADLDAAARLGINGTPTILINGRQMKTEATNADGIRKGIELMMARQGQGTTAPSQ